MKKNVSGQTIGAEMITTADGTAFTGSVTVSVTGDGGIQAPGSVGSGACTHEGNGYHSYAPAQAETNYDHVAFTFTGTGAIPVTIQVYTTDSTIATDIDTILSRIGTPAVSLAADLAAIDDFVDTEIAAILADTNELQTDWVNGGRLDLLIDAIKAKTDFLPSATAGSAGGLLILGANTATSGMSITSGTGTALSLISGATGSGLLLQAQGTSTYGLRITGSGGIDITNSSSARAGINIGAAGTGILVLATGGDGMSLISAVGDGLSLNGLGGDDLKLENSNSSTLATVIRNAVGLSSADLGTDIDTILSRIGSPAVSLAADIAALNDLSAAEINAEMVDALSVDTYAEPTGIPAATAPITTKLGRLYKILMRGLDVTGDEKIFKDSSGNAEWKKTLSDDGTTYTETAALAP